MDNLVQKRFQNDMSINNTTVEILQDQLWVPIPWRKLQVGDIVKVNLSYSNKMRLISLWLPVLFISVCCWNTCLVVCTCCIIVILVGFSYLLWLMCIIVLLSSVTYSLIVFFFFLCKWVNIYQTSELCWHLAKDTVFRKSVCVDYISEF